MYTGSPKGEIMPQIHQRQAFITKATREGVYTFQASSEKVDSYGDVVMQKGIDLSRFKENPIILYQHNSDEPIGRAVDMRLSEKGLVADVELAPFGVSEKIDTIRGLIEAGILKAVSIGFTALEHEIIRDKSGDMTGFKFVKSLLHEISIVSIPANDEALAIARSYNLPASEMRDIFTDTETLRTIQRNLNKVALERAKFKRKMS